MRAVKVETLLCVQPFPVKQQWQEILCKDKLGRAVINKSSMVFGSDKEIMHAGCGPRQGWGQDSGTWGTLKARSEGSHIQSVWF